MSARVRAVLVLVVMFVLTAVSLHCGSDGGSSNAAPPGADGGGDGDTRPTATLEILPPHATLTLTPGAAAPTQAFTVMLHDGAAVTDVTSSATLAVADASMGSLAGATFSASGTRVGTTNLTATFAGASGPLTATAAIDVKLTAVDGSLCPGCSAFPPDTAPTCAAAAAPVLAYPSDGVLLPPNLGSLAVQMTVGAGDSAFEIRLQNAVTDVRITSKCSALSDSRGAAVPNGCEVLLGATQWAAYLAPNHGGAPLTLSVRATTDGTCATAPTKPIGVAIADGDLTGALYWFSTSTSGTGGTVWRSTFGAAKAAERASPNDGLCYGCHAVSRDGARMVLNRDDADSDDEVLDVQSALYDVATSNVLAQNQAAGMQAFTHDHGLYVGTSSNGTGSRTYAGATGPTNVLFLRKGVDGGDATPASITIDVGQANARISQPDWSTDDKTIAFVGPSAVGGVVNGAPSLDDLHVFGGSIWTISSNGGAGAFAAPVELVKSQNGDNNYYPSLSPDGQVVFFDHVARKSPGGNLTDCTAGSCPNDSFSNPEARMFTVPVGGGTPRDLENANGSPAAAPIPVSCSRPRPSPFLHTAGTQKLVWIAFSSTRDYGLRVRNGLPGMKQCYPPATPENPNGSNTDTLAPTCVQPQIWIAAVDLAKGTGDPSFAAFWLPSQDQGAHNLSPSWTTQVATSTNGPDAGACIPTNGDCTARPSACCTGLCAPNGTCGAP